MADWPTRTKNQCEFLVSLGIDPKTVLDDSVNSAGYDVFDADKDDKRVYLTHGVLCHFVPWVNPESDFAGYRDARTKDRFPDVR